jgi:hypothetical protein
MNLFAEPDFTELVRAVLALALTIALPFVIYFSATGESNVVQAYQDALAAVVAFYFGTSSAPRN